MLSDDRGNYVYVINSKNEVERRPIKIGSVDDRRRDHRRRAESARKRVVLSAGPFLNPGQKVSPEAPGRALTLT